MVLNHVLSAQIAALSQGLPLAPAGAVAAVAPAPEQVAALAPEARRALLSAQAALARALQALAPDTAPSEAPVPSPAASIAPAADVPAADPTLAEQLAYLQKTSADLARVSEVLAG